MTREQARISFMQMIFQMDAQNDFSENAKDVYLNTNPVGNNEREYFEDMYILVSGNLEKIDEYINKAGDNWRTGRMAKVDLAILRISTAEMLFKRDIPDAVSINEAVKMAKVYGTENSQKFVNGILGKISQLKNE